MGSTLLRCPIKSGMTKRKPGMTLYIFYFVTLDKLERMDYAGGVEGELIVGLVGF